MNERPITVLTVSELTRRIKGLIDEGIPSVWVSGQISNFRPASSGHIYFTLKDNEAQLKATIWRSAVRKIRFEPHDGLEIIAHGRLDVYAPHGEYKLIVDEMQPKGLGALELAFRQLCAKLEKLGYFAPERKRPLPTLPRRLALVTSPTGAAIRDMLEIISRRWPAVEVWLCPVKVQGDGAAEDIASAIRQINRLSGIDVMIVGRGGGSREDLWAFNEECVAHAIFHSAIPVISAVGHEVDVSISDLVADRRALTPSEAAEIVVPSRDEVLESLRNTESRMKALLLKRLDFAKNWLTDLSQRRVFRLPLERIREREQRLDEWSDRLRRVVKIYLDRSNERIKTTAARLETLSPLNVLARGYSLTRKESDRSVMRSSQQVTIGERLITTLSDGEIISRVET